MAWTSIVNGQTGQAVSDKLDTEFAQLENDIASLESEKADKPILVLQSSNTTNQEPTALDTAMQIKFGSTQTNTHVFLDTDGTVNFLRAGHYHVEVRLQVGRTGTSGTSIVLSRCLKNNVQYGGGSAFKLDNADVLVPCLAMLHLDIAQNDTLKFQIMRDGNGYNSGGLYITTPSNGWNTIPSANITITKIG